MGEIVAVRSQLDSEIVEDADVVIGEAGQIVVANIDFAFRIAGSPNDSLTGMIEHNLR